MTDIYSLGISVDSTDAKIAKKDLDNLAKSADSTEKSVDDMGGSLDRTGNKARNAGKKVKDLSNEAIKGRNSIRSMRGAAGQLGFQLQDVAVQLQAGQDKMLVFGQQGSQIAGIFGPGGAVVGAILAVSAAIGSTLLVAFKTVRQEGQDLVDQIDDLTNGFERLTNAQIQFLNIELGAQIAKQEENLSKITKEIKQQQDDVAILTASYLDFADRGVTAGIESTSKAIKEQTNKIIELAAARDTESLSLEKLKERLAAINGVRTQEGVLTSVITDEMKARNEQLRLEWLAQKDQPWRLGVVDPDTLEKALEDMDKRITERRKKINEQLRLDWLGAREQPWMVGVVDGETLQKALDDMDKRISDAKEKRERENKESLDRMLRDEQNLHNSRVRLVEGFFNIAIDFFNRRADGDSEASKKAFENAKMLNRGLIISSTAAAIMNSLKYGDPVTKWGDAAGVALEGIRQLAANEASEFGGGGSPSSPSAPSVVNNNQSTSNSVVVNLNGQVNDPQQVIDIIQQYYDDDGEFRQ